MTPTRIIQNSIPVRYDPKVIVKPCETDRVPYLPLDILYQIAKALPQPKQVYNLARASKETWEYLQPALYECEVTYEARLANKYGGASSTSLERYYAEYFRPDIDYESSVEDGDYGWESNSESGDHSQEDPATQALCPFPEKSTSKRSGVSDECDGERISLQHRIFEAVMPETSNPLHVKGVLTALQWAAKQGGSALPVAQKAIRAAIAHQPSYIDGVDLQVRRLLRYGFKKYDDYISNCEYGVDGHQQELLADLPPPLFFAASHGNLKVFKALIDAGCDVNLLQSQSMFEWSCLTCSKDTDEMDHEPIMSFKIHKECMIGGGSDDCICDDDGGLRYHEDGASFCQTIGHVAVRYDQSEMLKILLLSGLDIQIQQIPHSSLHVMKDAVMEGSLTAVKTLLNHDPSLASSIFHGETLLHSVQLMKRHGAQEVQYGTMRGIISCLLDNGAIMDASGDNSDHEDNRLRNSPELTPLESALSFAHINPGPYIFTALQAAELFIRMGADWTHTSDPFFWRERWGARLFSVTMGKDPSSSARILNMCLENIVIVERCETPPGAEAQARRLRLRRFWHRVLKAIVDTASGSLIHGNSQTMEFSSAFAYLANLLPNSFRKAHYCWKRTYCCPLSAGEVGRLLLSTGITPSDADLKIWTLSQGLPSDEDIRG